MGRVDPEIVCGCCHNLVTLPPDYRLIHLKPLLLPRGEPFPQTQDAWYYLADLYEQGLLERDAEIRRLKLKINQLEQKA